MRPEGQGLLGLYPPRIACVWQNGHVAKPLVQVLRDHQPLIVNSVEVRKQREKQIASRYRIEPPSIIPRRVCQADQSILPEARHSVSHQHVVPFRLLFMATIQLRGR